jgi:hypothetical protein
MLDKVKCLGTQTQILADMKITIEAEMVRQVDCHIQHLADVEHDEQKPAPWKRYKQHEQYYHHRFVHREGSNVPDRGRIGDQVIKNGDFACVGKNKAGKKQDRNDGVFFQGRPEMDEENIASSSADYGEAAHGYMKLRSFLLR